MKLFSAAVQYFYRHSERINATLASGAFVAGVQTLMNWSIGALESLTVKYTKTPQHVDRSKFYRKVLPRYNREFGNKPFSLYDIKSASAPNLKGK